MNKGTNKITINDLIDLEKAGFSAKELYFDPFFNIFNISLKEMKEAGFSAKDFKKAGLDLNTLKLGRVLKLFSARDLKEAGYSAEPMKRIRGFSAKDLKEAGFSAKVLRDECDFTATDLINAGFEAKDIPPPPSL
tara:strand:+ start:483 stop:887 length:405 start_codon:yes stop_codon:yes gene_type:complete